MKRNLSPHPNVRRGGLSPAAPVPAAAPTPLNKSRTAQARSILRQASKKLAYPVLHLAKKILELDEQDTELNYSASYRRGITDKTLHETAHILYHLDLADIKAMIEGDFKKLRASKTLPDQLTHRIKGDPIEDTVRLPEVERLPVIYQHYHVNPAGDIMPEYRSIAYGCMKYLDVMKATEDGETQNQAFVGFVKLVDAMVPAPSENKAPRVAYTCPYPRYGHSKSAIKALKQWVMCIFSMHHHTPVADRNKPLKHALSEIGWTITYYARRFEHHEHGDRSNKIMNIVDAVTRHLFPHKNYRWEWIIVLEVAAAHLPSPAERTISRLSISYTTYGGTNQALGGLSVTSGDKSLANIAFCETANSIAKKMQERMQHDKKHIDHLLNRIRSAQSTEDAYRKLEVTEDDLAKMREGLDEIDETLAEETEGFKEAVPGWSERVTKQNQTLLELDGMQTAAVAMKELLRALD